jgi:hypothetical protein
MSRTAHLSREERLLCRLARVPRPDEPHDVDGLDDPALDWGELWNLALRHEVQPLVWAHLRSRPELRSAVPAQLAQTAERRYFASALRNRSRSAELARILEILHRGGVPVMPVKGVVLDELVYGGDAPRTFDDLDIVVRRRDLPAARAALGELGYRGRPVPRFEEVDHRFHDLQLFRPVDGAEQCLEIHWDLWPSARFDSIIEDLWERAVPARVAGVAARVLSDEDTVLHLAVHRTSSALRLRFVCDVAELVRRRADTLDWDALEARAEAVGARIALHMALRLARDLLEAPVPDGIVVRTQPDRLRRRLLERTCGTRALFRRVPHDDHAQQPRLGYRILEQDRPARVIRSLVAGLLRKRAKAAYNRRVRPA